MPRWILATTAIALALANPAWAQQQPDQLDGRSPDTTTRQPDLQPDRQAQSQSPDELPTDQLALAQADTIKGSAVRNAQGEEIGDIRDVVLDVKKGSIAFAVVGVGGFLGVGEKDVAVPWNRLKPGNEPQSFVLNVDRQTLEGAPAIDTEDVAAMQDPMAREQISQFWQGVPQQAQSGPQPR